MPSSQAIGIFDSGIGGLTVVREVMRFLPLESIVYLGDTARLPYGTKSRETVTGYSRKNSQFLASKDVKIIIAACNTASAHSVSILSDEVEVPILGVIEPGVKKACRITRNGKIGVIATPSTIRSGEYARVLGRENPLLKTVSISCPLFVSLVEEGWVEGEIAVKTARKYLAPLKDEDIDTLILGCTHYPLMKKTISEVMGKKVTLVDSAEETAAEVADFMKINGLLSKNGESSSEFYLTDGSENFLGIARRFLGSEIKEVQVVDFS